MLKRKHQLEIPASAASPRADTEALVFSLKHLDAIHPKFRLEQCGDGYLRNLLLTIQNYSSYTVDQFRDQNNQDDRHTIDFSETSEINGFTSLDENLQLEESWQIKICPSIKNYPELGWRASGFLVSSTFYIVWLDPDHKLYPDHHPNHTGSQRIKQKKR